jgi:hypothetical protein
LEDSPEVFAESVSNFVNPLAVDDVEAEEVVESQVEQE